MWKIFLMLVVFNDQGELVQVVGPVRDMRFETVEICERVAAKLLAEVPPPDGYKVLPLCLEPPT